MAERTTLARPYAEAVFRLASESSSLQRWGDVLGYYAIAVADKNLAFALGDPSMTGEQIDSLMASLLEDISDQEQTLLCMLRENGKLQLLPEISTLFNELRASAEWLQHPDQHCPGCSHARPARRAKRDPGAKRH